MSDIGRRDFLKVSFGLLLLASARKVAAHAKLLRSLPKSSAELQEQPKIVELWFNELLDDEFNTIQIFPAKELNRPDRKSIARGKARIDPKDRTHLTVDLPKLVPDTYVVEYRVLSRDGHTATARITFTLLPPR